jgi:hypothetical protein
MWEADSGWKKRDSFACGPPDDDTTRNRSHFGFDSCCFDPLCPRSPADTTRQFNGSIDSPS